MMDQILDKVLSQGIWCCVAIYMIYNNNKKYTALERYVRDKLIEVVEKNTEVVKRVEEKLDNAHKNRS